MTSSLHHVCKVRQLECSRDEHCAVSEGRQGIQEVLKRGQEHVWVSGEWDEVTSTPGHYGNQGDPNAQDTKQLFGRVEVLLSQQSTLPASHGMTLTVVLTLSTPLAISSALNFVLLELLPYARYCTRGSGCKAEQRGSGHDTKQRGSRCDTE